MVRDQRVNDNWALLHAQRLALEQRRPLLVACPFAADYPRAPRGQTSFMLAGLDEVNRGLRTLGIPMLMTGSSPASSLTDLAGAVDSAVIVTDFNPLRESRAWKSKLSGRATAPIYEVDAHNIIPAWETSDKQEYAAYTIRPRIKRRLPEFLTVIPAVEKHPFAFDRSRRAIPHSWSDATEFLGVACHNTTPRGTTRRATVNPGCRLIYISVNCRLKGWRWKRSVTIRTWHHRSRFSRS
jgi:deoxyribodipyrimidine photo-lyase